MFNLRKHPFGISSANQSFCGLAGTFVLFAMLSTSPAFGANKDMIQLQTQVQELQDAVARLQQSNDERMGVMKDLIQQSADSVNKMSTSVTALERQLQTAAEAQNAKGDQISGQIQSLNDSLDEIKARLGRLEKVTQDVQGQQQSISAAVQNVPSSGTALSDSAPPSTAAGSSLDQRQASMTRKSKPAAGTPLIATPDTTAASGVPPADELYKTALGDYMAAKYTLAASEFGDVVKFYPDTPLAGNSVYYQAEMDYRAGRYPSAVNGYDSVIERYPASNKVPVAHLHKGQALIALKQNEAGMRELRSLIQRFPNSPEAVQARSRLSGMGRPGASRR